MGELVKSQYVYVAGTSKLFRVDVSNLDEAELEYVLFDDGDIPELPFRMQLFSHCHSVYMIGGAHIDREDKLHVFDPTKFKKFPVSAEYIDSHKKLGKEFNQFIPVTYPVIPANSKVYFFSSTNYRMLSFDPPKFQFETLPSPPCPVDERNKLLGRIVFRGYIYLFVEYVRIDDDPVPDPHPYLRFDPDPHPNLDRVHAFAFNTTSSQWQERESVVRQFQLEEIPLPSNHIGNIVVSDEFSDNTQIMVTLCLTRPRCQKRPIAYRLDLRGGDDVLWPISYRFLDEIFIETDADENGKSRCLFDMGGGRFCVLHFDPQKPFLISVFKIDFNLEHEIQIALGKGSSISHPNYSSEILSSRTFDPYFYSVLDGVCLASAPGNQHLISTEEGDEVTKARAGIES